MRPKNEKAGPAGRAAKPTSNLTSHGALEITARMHFYAVRSNGDQLRWAHAPRIGKKPDRMVGR
jgi:hypothetical protein